MTTIALSWDDVPEDLPVVIVVGNADRELRKKALRAGSDEASISTSARDFRKGSSDPGELYASIVDVPGGGQFVLFDASRLWHVEFADGPSAAAIAKYAAVCQRASGVIVERIDSLNHARSVAGVPAAFNVPKAGVWVDRLPLDPPEDERKKQSTKLAKECFTGVKVFEGDLKEIANCQCGDVECETCGAWHELLELVTVERKVKKSDFRIFVNEITGWGVAPHTRIVRGVQRGTIEAGDEIEVRSGREREVTTVKEVARGGVVFTMPRFGPEEIDAIAKPGTLEARDVVAARAKNEPTGTAGAAYIDGSHMGRVSVGAVGKKRILRFSRAVPFRRGDVVTIFHRDDESMPFLADSYVILDD